MTDEQFSFLIIVLLAVTSILIAVAIQYFVIEWAEALRYIIKTSLFVDVCFTFFIFRSGTSVEEPCEGKDWEKEVVESLHPIYWSIFPLSLLSMLSKERRSLRGTRRVI